MRFNIRYIFLLTLSLNFFFQEKINSHNKFNGGCQTQCYKKEIKYESNSKKFKNIKFLDNNNINSCLNKNLCRG